MKFYKYKMLSLILKQYSSVLWPLFNVRFYEKIINSQYNICDLSIPNNAYAKQKSKRLYIALRTLKDTKYVN